MKIATVLPEGFLLNQAETCSASLSNWWVVDFPFLNPHWYLFISPLQISYENQWKSTQSRRHIIGLLCLVFFSIYSLLTGRVCPSIRLCSAKIDKNQWKSINVDDNRRNLVSTMHPRPRLTFFLSVPTRIYARLCQSVRRSVGCSVGPSPIYFFGMT